MSTKINDTKCKIVEQNYDQTKKKKKNSQQNSKIQNCFKLLEFIKETQRKYKQPNENI